VAMKAMRHVYRQEFLQPLLVALFPVSRKSEAAVIAGIVFEDTIRRICRVLSLTENGAALDTLISELARRSPPVLTAPTAMPMAIGHASTGWIPAQQSASFSGAPKGCGFR